MRAQTFEHIEALSGVTVQRLPEVLRVRGEGDPEILLIVRLLSGALAIKHCYTGKVVQQRLNYFSGDLKSIRSRWDLRFPELLGEEVDAEEFGQYIKMAKFRNRVFFKNILTELCNFTLHSSRGNHTSAFVFIYRVLENISYSFPLIYVSRTDDFKKTFSYLKDLMDGKEKGELGFYRAFIEKLYNDDPIGESTLDFDITVADEDTQQRIFRILNDATQGTMQSAATDAPRTLSIKFCEIGSFIIVVRNRFFHYMNGGAKNFDSENIVDSDLFFSLLNTQFMHWLATVFLGILSHHIAQLDYRSVPTD